MKRTLSVMTIPRILCLVASFVLLTGTARPQSHESHANTTLNQTSLDSPIRFTYQPIDFKLDSDETPQRHAPETMAGGVAVFDYNNDGKLDIFFTNGANIQTLKKDSPKYSNRLFENDGHGHFTDVTEKAGLSSSSII
jgi:enediyne biosynthesis protein E4